VFFTIYRYDETQFSEEEAASKENAYQNETSRPISTLKADDYQKMLEKLREEMD